MRLNGTLSLPSAVAAVAGLLFWMLFSSTLSNYEFKFPGLLRLAGYKANGSFFIVKSAPALTLFLDVPLFNFSFFVYIDSFYFYSGLLTLGVN